MMNRPFVVSASFALMLLGVVAAGGQTFRTIGTFSGANGANPDYAPLVQGTDGNYYGTTQKGGTYGFGTVFYVTPSGTLHTLHSFDSTDGAYPNAGLLLGTDENFYGTTVGVNGDSTVFKITREGTLHTLASLGEVYCEAGLVQGTDGSLYGTTGIGGAYNLGMIFRITTEGALTTLHSFDGGDGENPGAPLVQATDGNFYGTTSSGGSYGSGTAFKMSASGVVTTLHNFDFTDGASPAGMMQATNGEFYGTTLAGGANNDGTIFKMTSSGTITMLHSFDSTDGSLPKDAPLQATDGNLYGTTSEGGVGQTCGGGCGTIFRLTPGGTVTTLHSFNSVDGFRPSAGLLQATSGSFYGTTFGGGAYYDGTLFGLSSGLGPFVSTLPSVRKVGQGVIILGNSLKGSTRVTFNGTAAVFTIVSNTEIATTVPYGATTGPVKVVTPGGTLKSNVPFRVIR